MLLLLLQQQELCTAQMLSACVCGTRALQQTQLRQHQLPPPTRRYD